MGGGGHSFELPQKWRVDREDVLVEPILEAKDYDDKPFKQMFEQCDAILSETKILVVTGYSLHHNYIF